MNDDVLFPDVSAPAASGVPIRETITAKKPQIHWSHISQFTKCGEQYRRRHIENEIRPPGVAAHIGGATHKSIECDLHHKMATGKLATLEAIAEAAVDEVKRRFERDGIHIGADEKGRKMSDIRGEAIDEAIRLGSLHHAELAPGIEPAYLERPWVVEMRGFPHDLAGRIDLMEKTYSGTEKSFMSNEVKTFQAYRIRDTKTTKRSPPVNSADNSDQMTMYALAAKVLDGSIPTLQMDFLVKTKKAKVVSLKTWRTDADLVVLLRRLETFSDALRKGVFIPAPRDSWQCSEKWCGYYSTCPFVRGRVQI